jgi:hypothetical protein
VLLDALVLRISALLWRPVVVRVYLLCVCVGCCGCWGVVGVGALWVGVKKGGRVKEGGLLIEWRLLVCAYACCGFRVLCEKEHTKGTGYVWFCGSQVCQSLRQIGEQRCCVCLCKVYIPGISDLHL